MVPLVAVVDDDVSVRRSLDRLIRSVNLDGESVWFSGRVLGVGPTLQGGLSDIGRAPAGDEWNRTPLAPAGVEGVTCRLFLLRRMGLTTVRGQKRRRIGLLVTLLNH